MENSSKKNQDYLEATVLRKPGWFIEKLFYEHLISHSRPKENFKIKKNAEEVAIGD